MIRDLILYPFRLLNQVMRRDCSWNLRTYELRLIDASAVELSPANRLAFEKQLASSFFVERMHQDRITRIHFHWPDSLARMDLPEDYQLARLKLKHSRQSLTVTVEAYKGFVFALQYSKPPKPVVLEHFEIVPIEYGGHADDSVTRSIDREEHGYEDKT